MPEKNVAALIRTISFAQSRNRPFQAGGPVPFPSIGEGGSYRDLLDADEFERGAALIIFQAKLDDFAHSFHESVEILRLRVATAQGRNGSDIVVVFVPFDDDRELSRASHEPILARHRLVPAAYCSFAYSARACFRIGTSASASFQIAKKSL